MNESSSRQSKWHSGELYTSGQPFRTLASDIMHARAIGDAVTRLVDDPATAKGLEVGPGITPILQYSGIKDRYYLETSAAVARQLRRLTPDAGVLLHGINEIPVSRKPHFDIAVAAEVLTHVPKADRLRALAELADRAKAIVIVDRPALPEQELKRELSEIHAHRQASLGKTTLRQTEVPQAEIDREAAERVDFDAIQAHLKQKGFLTRGYTIKERGGSYRILLARRTSRHD